MADYQPEVLRQVKTRSGILELIEWRWPDILEFQETVDELMLEHSLPPYSTDSTAEFPHIAPDVRCFMGTLFIRYPGVMVHGRGEGLRSRVVRVTFSPELARRTTGNITDMPLSSLQSLLDIRSDILRNLLKLAHLELTRLERPSSAAIDAYVRLMAIEVQRIMEQQGSNPATGRLAPWQHRRIKQHLREVSARPKIEELAQLCGISSRHLQRQFASLTGKSIAKYVEDYWVERARELLATTSTPIKVIAAECGFCHANSFARAFGRATGVLPHLFRQKSSAAGLLR